MVMKGSVKNQGNLSSVLFLGAIVMSRDIVNTLGSEALFYVAIVIVITFALELVFKKRETISHDSEVIHFDLNKYIADIKIEDIDSIYLSENINDLTVEMDGSKHFYKLYGFRRKTVQKFIDEIRTGNGQV